MPDSMNAFLTDVSNGNMFSYQQKDFTASEIEFNNFRFNEEIDSLDQYGNLKLRLFFRFLFMESTRSKDPVGQRHRIYKLMIEYGMTRSINKEEEDDFCVNYNHAQWFDSAEKN
jgi:hypothetical protein